MARKAATQNVSVPHSALTIRRLSKKSSVPTSTFSQWNATRLLWKRWLYRRTPTVANFPRVWKRKSFSESRPETQRPLKHRKLPGANFSEIMPGMFVLELSYL